MKLRHDVLRFPEGKTKAFTMSYDDGVVQDKRLIALMKAHGVKGTFNLNSAAFGQVDQYSHLRVKHEKLPAEEIVSVYEGMEIATHAVTHPDLTAIPDNTVLYEILGDRQALEKLTGRLIRGHAYPFGTYNERVIEDLRIAGILYARTVKSTHDFRIPQEFLAWHPTCHHEDPKLMELTEEFLAANKAGRPGLKVFYVWGHAYEFDNNDNWEIVETLLKKISGQDDIWYATNSEIAEYLEAASQLQYSADGNLVRNPTSRTIWLNVLDREYVIRSGETVVIDRT